MDLEVFVTDLLGSHILLQRLDLSSSAVLVCAANEESVVTSEAAVPSEDVSAEDAPNYVAKMRHVVDVGEGAGYQDILLFLAGENLLAMVSPDYFKCVEFSLVFGRNLHLYFFLFGLLVLWLFWIGLRLFGL